MADDSLDALDYVAWGVYALSFAKMVRTKGSELLAVQSLRNTIIASTFIGGFAFTTASAYISFIEGNPSTSDKLRAGILAAVLYIAFLNFALVVRTGSHLGYLLGSATGQLDNLQHPSMRRTAVAQPSESVTTALNGTTTQPDHTNINVQPSSDSILRQITLETERRVEPPLQALEAADVAERCKHMIKAMSFHFSLGFRSFYYAIPVAMYAVGPVVFMVSSVLLVIWLVYIDHGMKIS